MLKNSKKDDWVSREYRREQHHVNNLKGLHTEPIEKEDHTEGMVRKYKKDWKKKTKKLGKDLFVSFFFGITGFVVFWAVLDWLVGRLFLGINWYLYLSIPSPVFHGTTLVVSLILFRKFYKKLTDK